MQSTKVAGMIGQACHDSILCRDSVTVPCRGPVSRDWELSDEEWRVTKKKVPHQKCSGCCHGQRHSLPDIV